ncbi:ATPase [Aureococcus anophagefferens]|nr:ATPase [Aureococcus anophagefferens]
MYEGEIFSLLGHNGAGKSTTCGLLTGIVASDSKRDDGGAVVYGHGIRGGMTAVRQLAGFCPQHDCLFEKLSCYEHVVFFGRLKGRAQADAERAAADLLDRFRLGDRRSHLACELSGGMRRKLSTAIALCGGSKFALLDEPTAGMDALARRELWDLLAAVKRDRTRQSAAAPSLRKFDELLARKLGEGAKRLTEGAEAAHDDVIVATLPSTALPHFAGSSALESQKRKLEIASYGVAVSTLEDVFLKVDGQHARLDRDAARGATARALGSGRAYVPSPATQIYGLAKARLSVAKRSKADAFNALFPILGFFASFLCDKYEMFGKGDLSLRSLLAVMGVDAPTYWVGNFVGDGALYGVVLAAMWAIMIGVAPQRWIRQGAMSYLLPVWGAFLIAYAYSLSFLFGTSPARAVVGIPGLNLLLTMLPQTIVLVAWVLAHKRFPKIFTKARVETGQFWLGAVTSPYTSFWIGFFQMGAGHFRGALGAEAARGEAERDLSGGMKRKLCCAIALIGDPACVLLDEPSAGLDPVARRNLWNVLGAAMSARASC